MKERFVIILAAGQGTRMKSKLYKVLHPIAGKPMVELVLEEVEQISPQKVVTIVGCGAEQVQTTLGNRSEYAIQTEQLGTGHAVLQAKELLSKKVGTTLVICGDTPLLTAKTLNELLLHHEKQQAKATVLTADTPDPTGYGRIIRDKSGNLQKIVEQKDANPEEASIHEFNTGTYCFDNQELFSALEKVGNDNARNEYYLPDVIEILNQENKIVSAYKMDSFEDSMGVNDRMALAKATAVMRHRINEQHIQNGVTFIDPDHTYVDKSVVIGSDTVIEAGVVLKGETIIGSDCFIGTGTEIKDSLLKNNVTILSSYLEEATVGDHTDIGPFSHLRPKSELGEHVHVGNFVEVKKAKIGNHTKVGHLTYVGDAELGENINVGCGTVFVNYDGKNKYKTIVGDHAFIGSSTNIIAPVTIGKNSATAAGSTINQDIPEDSLAIGRARQVNKLGYAKNLPYFS